MATHLLWLAIAPTLAWTPALHLNGRQNQCDATSFPQDLGDTQCMGLHKVDAASEGECCAACLADGGGYGCTTYGWCEAGNDCDTKENVAGCWIGTSTNCRNQTSGWAARRRPTPPPLPPSADYYYTRFHAQPLKNWLNDPNGPMWFKGVYHLFFQYNPKGKHWGDMHWYHMTSTDLMHWKHQPVALAPDQSYDCGGIFSGSATIVHDVPVLTYSVACGRYVVNAYPANASDPNLTYWTKPSYNPVMKVPPSVRWGRPAYPAQRVARRRLS